MGIPTSEQEILSVIEQKNFQNFLNRTGRRSEGTKKVNRVGVTLLATFLQKPHPDDTVSIITKANPCDLLDAFVAWLQKEGYKDSSILAFFRAAKKWLRYNGVKVYNEDIRDNIELPKPEEPADDAPTKEEIRKILSLVQYRTQNKMLLLACSGVRPGDLKYLKWSDFKWDEHPVRLIVPPRGKMKKGWETFITSELAIRLRAQKNFMQGESLWNFIDEHHLGNAFRNALKKLPDLDTIIEISRRNKSKRHKLHLYSLKKFFNSNTKVEVGEDISKAWQGRKGYLSTYDKIRLEDKQKLYIKCLPRLTIFAETEKQKTLEDNLRERLRLRGISEEQIDKVLEGLVLN